MGSNTLCVTEFCSPLGRTKRATRRQPNMYIFGHLHIPILYIEVQMNAPTCASRCLCPSQMRYWHLAASSSANLTSSPNSCCIQQERTVLVVHVALPTSLLSHVTKYASGYCSAIPVCMTNSIYAFRVRRSSQTLQNRDRRGSPLAPDYGQVGSWVGSSAIPGIINNV